MEDFKAGDRVLVALKDPNGLDRNDYIETSVLWIDETFILTGKKGLWPTLSKLSDVSIKPLKD